MADDEVNVTRAGINKSRLNVLNAGARTGLGLAANFLINRVHAVFALAAPRGRASGRTIRSIGVSPIIFKDGAWRCRVGPSVISGYWLHQGTGPAAGHGPRRPPPVDAILQWIKEKGIVPRSISGGLKGKAGLVYARKRHKKAIVDREMRQLAFMIARKIGRDGTLPFPYLTTAFVASKVEMQKIITQSIINSLRG